MNLYISREVGKLDFVIYQLSSNVSSCYNDCKQQEHPAAVWQIGSR